jgi:hypothetical protein
MDIPHIRVVLLAMLSHIIESRPFTQGGFSTDGMHFILRVSVKQVLNDESSLLGVLGKDGYMNLFRRFIQS